MDRVLASKPVCPGIRFYPTDEELFMFYLKRKVMGKSFPHLVMSEENVYGYAPWDLPDKCCLNTKDLYWYFFCPHVKKYAKGARVHRLNDIGFWKSTGNDRTVHYRGRSVGKIKTLIFHRGKPHNGDRTDWVMHEYKLQDQLLDESVPQDSYVICKIYQKSGPGPKNGEHYGAPFVEEEWESDNEDNLNTDQEPVLHPEDVAPSDNLNVVNTPASFVPSSAEPGSVTAAWTPSTTTDHTTAAELVHSASDEPLPIRLSEPLENDCYGGLEDLCVNGSCSTARFIWPQWPVDCCGVEYLELNDINDVPYSFPTPLIWSQPALPQQPVMDPDGFIELDDIN